MKVEHIALYVEDLEAARVFFMKYLGASSNAGYHNQKTDFRSYFLTFDDGARLELMHKPDMTDMPKTPSRTGYAHIAFGVGSRERVDALTAELRAAGYEVVSGPGSPVTAIMRAASPLLRETSSRSPYKKREVTQSVTSLFSSLNTPRPSRCRWWRACRT